MFACLWMPKQHSSAIGCKSIKEEFAKPSVAVVPDNTPVQPKVIKDKAAYQKKSLAATRDSLNDPDSAKFKNVFIHGEWSADK